MKPGVFGPQPGEAGVIGFRVGCGVPPACEGILSERFLTRYRTSSQPPRRQSDAPHYGILWRDANDGGQDAHPPREFRFRRCVFSPLPITPVLTCFLPKLRTTFQPASYLQSCRSACRYPGRNPSRYPGRNPRWSAGRDSSRGAGGRAGSSRISRGATCASS